MLVSHPQLFALELSAMPRSLASLLLAVPMLAMPVQAQVMRAPGYYLPPPKPESRTASARGRDVLDLNTATVEQLCALPGMGPEYARRVIAGRPYRMRNQLVRRGILPVAEYNRISDRIVARRESARQIVAQEEAAGLPARSSSH